MFYVCAMLDKQKNFNHCHRISGEDGTSRRPAQPAAAPDQAEPPQGRGQVRRGAGRRASCPAYVQFSGGRVPPSQALLKDGGFHKVRRGSRRALPGMQYLLITRTRSSFKNECI